MPFCLQNTFLQRDCAPQQTPARTLQIPSKVTEEDRDATEVSSLNPDISTIQRATQHSVIQRCSKCQLLFSRFGLRNGAGTAEHEARPFSIAMFTSAGLPQTRYLQRATCEFLETQRMKTSTKIASELCGRFRQCHLRLRNMFFVRFSNCRASPADSGTKKSRVGDVGGQKASQTTYCHNCRCAVRTLGMRMLPFFGC